MSRDLVATDKFSGNHAIPGCQRSVPERRNAILLWSFPVFFPSAALALFR